MQVLQTPFNANTWYIKNSKTGSHAMLCSQQYLVLPDSQVVVLGWEQG